MNKNKIIFGIIAAIILGAIILLVSNLQGEKTKVVTVKSGDFSVWILNDDASDFSNFIKDFKEKNKAYSNKSIIVESFSDEETYYNALVSANVTGEGPDMFVMNNSEVSPLENQTQGIDPALISPNDFRLRFKTVFGEDLIVSDTEDDTVEFIKGIPLGYEALGLYYNRKYFLRPSEMKTWGDFGKEVKYIANKYSKVIPIALGNGIGVTYASEIIQAFLALEGVGSLSATTAVESRQVLSSYSFYGEKNGDNRYNILSAPFINDTDIDFFTQGDVAAMIGYPRELMKINDIGYQKSFLFVTPFPHIVGSERVTSINYNYFVLNKQSNHIDMGQTLLQYMASEEGQLAYLENFPYYLPAELSVEAELKEKKILSQYNIIYKNFISEDATLISFDVGNKIQFDTRINTILDIETDQDDRFAKMKSYITCSSTKQKTLLNLSSPCK